MQNIDNINQWSECMREISSSPQHRILVKRGRKFFFIERQEMGKQGLQPASPTLLIRKTEKLMKESTPNMTQLDDIKAGLFHIIDRKESRGNEKVEKLYRKITSLLFPHQQQPSSKPKETESEQIVKSEAITIVKSKIGGSTGAQLIKWEGKEHVMKRGVSPEHCINEYRTTKAYEVLGVLVPHTQLIWQVNHDQVTGQLQASQSPSLITGFITGVTLTQYLKTASRDEKEAIYEKIRRHFVADCLLANWDIVANLGNILVDTDGNPYRIDNGGGLSFRAQGKSKDSRWGEDVNELHTLRDKRFNRHGATIYRDITDDDIIFQINEILQKKEALLNTVGENAEIVSRRLDYLSHYRDQLLKERAEYTERLRKTLQDPSATLHFDKRFAVERVVINHIPLESTKAADYRSIAAVECGEPPFEPEKGFKTSAGCIIQEPDGRIWIFEPTGHFGGYSHTFPKGRQEEGLTLQQTAVKEVWEETGLQVEITGFLSDQTRKSTKTRYYLARRVGGHPACTHWESHSVKLIPLTHGDRYLNTGRDRHLVDMLMKQDLALRLAKQDITLSKVDEQGTILSFWQRIMQFFRYMKDGHSFRISRAEKIVSSLNGSSAEEFERLNLTQKLTILSRLRQYVQNASNHDHPDFFAQFEALETRVFNAPAEDFSRSLFTHFKDHKVLCDELKAGLKKYTNQYERNAIYKTYRETFNDLMSDAKSEKEKKRLSNLHGKVIKTLYQASCVDEISDQTRSDYGILALEYATILWGNKHYDDLRLVFTSLSALYTEANPPSQEMLTFINKNLFGTIFSSTAEIIGGKKHYEQLEPLFHLVNLGLREYTPSALKCSLQIKFANLPFNGNRTAFTNLYLNNREQVQILVDEMHRLEERLVHQIVQAAKRVEIPIINVYQLVKRLVNPKYSIHHDVRQKIIEAFGIKNIQKDITTVIKEMSYGKTSATQSSPLVEELIDVWKIMQFFHQQLKEHDDEIRIPKWYHATKAHLISPILSSQVIKISTRQYFGTWFSTRPEINYYGSTVLAFDHHVESLDAKPRNIFLNKRWRALRTVAPFDINSVKRAHLAFVAIDQADKTARKATKLILVRKLKEEGLQSVNILTTRQALLMQKEIARCLGTPNLPYHWW